MPTPKLDYGRIKAWAGLAGGLDRAHGRFCMVLAGSMQSAKTARETAKIKFEIEYPDVEITTLISTPIRERE